MNAAQITDAHIAKARAYGYTTDKGVQMAAQFIANNEAAKAERDQLRAEVERLKHGTVAQFKDAFIEELKRENAELRASCDEHAKGYVETRKRIATLETEIDRLHAINAVRESAIARAERAEAELHALRLVCGTTDADKFSTWVDRANTRAEKAEAELAGIRALANRRNKRDHSADTTHQLVVALDQALDIAQAELAQFRELDTERARMRQIAVDKRIRTSTPRTDEEAGSLIDAEEVVPADFARTLERELVAEREKVRVLRKTCIEVERYAIEGSDNETLLRAALAATKDKP